MSHILVIGFYGMFGFLPTSLCVVVSWASFWVKLDIAPARVTLGIATFLTLATQQNAIIGGLPRVSYVKAIDIWMIGCQVFVFGTLLQYAIAQVRSA